MDVLVVEVVFALGDCEVPVRAAYNVALLSGPDGAHQTFNDSNSTLCYLCISTMIAPVVNFYPESNWVGFLLAPGWRQKALVSRRICAS